MMHPSTGMTRRSFLTITAMTGGLLAAGGVARLGRSDASSSQPVTVRDERLLMGTVIHLAVVAPDAVQGQGAIAATFSAMQRLIGYFDYRRADSALGILNRTGELANPPAEFTALLAQAQAISALSDGAFDVTVQPLLDAYGRGESDPTPYAKLVDYRRLSVDAAKISLGQPGMAITLDGLAKGRVIDEAVTTLQKLGFDRVLVEAGGDMMGVGQRADSTPWRVGVANPRSKSGELLATLNLADGALATSGDYMNYFVQDFSAHHIVDPRTGHSPSELASVTVMAPTATEADALSTTFMVLGVAQGEALAARLPNIEALFVTKTLQHHATSGFPKTTRS
ncbi:MAG: FAD:protein FMN transferase [Caldilineaceae bacterium]|nr:FAD:protein FMN transferase [Caldilineaceae bacterium]MBP8106342.1 FAD:protein FMN transferase [Caldilineaceae bacterium]MBP8125053.1 FAD:protein FMN transferase [Caldilineaceae bacterium]MBP9074841.1 FAD:protein FMN transferase [Caldilineaceae bacterium]